MKVEELYVLERKRLVDYDAARKFIDSPQDRKKLEEWAVIKKRIVMEEWECGYTVIDVPD